MADEESAIKPFEDLFEICVGTQEYFWKNVIDNLGDQDGMKRILSQLGDGTNSDYLYEKIQKQVEGLTRSVSVKTSLLLMALILKVVYLEIEGPDKTFYDIKSFDLQLERSLNEFLQTDAFKYLTSQVL